MHKLLSQYLGKSALRWSNDENGNPGGGADPIPADPDNGGGTGDGAIAPSTLLGGDEESDEAKAKTDAEAAAAAAEEQEYKDDPNLSAEENAAKKKEFDDAKAKAKEENNNGDEEEAPKPEDYEIIEVPEGFDLDPEIEQKFRNFASENKLSKEVVKNLQELQVELVNKQSEEHAARVKKWGEDLKTDKEIGGKALAENIGAARAALKEFFSPAAKSILDNTGLGNHPDIVKGFVRLGKVMGENPSFKGGAVDQKITIADALYGGGNSGDSAERS